MYRKIILSCLLFIFLFSCKKDTPSGIIVDIEDDFYIDLFEEIGTSGLDFQIELSTINEQDCLNYEIDVENDFDQPNRSIELTINDLVAPGSCIEGSAHTYETVTLGTLEPNLYVFNINLKDAVINEGKLRVAANRYEIEMETDDGIEVINNILYKIPRNTIWGYVAYSNSNAAGSASNFITGLTELSTVFEIENNPDYVSGYYGYFTLGDDMAVSLRNEESLDVNNFMPFVFRHNSSDMQDIIDQADQACAENSNIEITLFAETGWTYSCN